MDSLSQFAFSWFDYVYNDAGVLRGVEESKILLIRAAFQLFQSKVFFVDWVIMFVKKQDNRSFIVFVVRNKYIRSISNKDSIRIIQLLLF